MTNLNLNEKVGRRATPTSSCEKSQCSSTNIK